MRKSHFDDEFLVLLGPIISRLFTCSNEEKKKGACSSPISMILTRWELWEADPMNLNNMSTADIVSTVEECLPHQLIAESPSLALPLTP
jgi:hypothetical protein